MKTIWGLFATHQDAGGALDGFRRQGIAAEDLSALARPAVPQGGAPTGKTGGPGQAQGGRSKQPGQDGAASPPRQANSPAPGGPGGRQVRLPGVRTVRLSGSPPLLASGRLATVLEQAQAQLLAPDASAEATHREPQADTAKRAGLAGVLVALGLPEGYAANYASGVSRGQVLLAVRVPDERERDAVMLMRRYRVMQLAGQPMGDEA